MLRRRRMIAEIMFGVLLMGLQIACGDDQLAVPSSGEINKAEVVVNDLFKEEYTKTKAADRVALANKLLEQAAGLKDDNASRFVLLRDARDLAAKAGDAVVAMKAADELATEFQVGAGEARAAAAEPLVAAIITPASAGEIAQALLAAAESAQSAEDETSARQLAKAAEVASHKAQSVPLVAAAKAKLAELDSMREESEKVKQQLVILKKNPDDPAANLAAGRYLCFFKHDWDSGVRMLAKGADARLKEAAQKDLKATGGGEPDKLAAADAWYEMLPTLDAATKSSAQLHALGWYQSALPDLSGLSKAKAEKRVAELSAVSEARADKSNVWATIRKAVADGQLKKWNIIGGAFSHTEFEELPKDGAILIGFAYATRSNGRYPAIVQPIFKTARGEVKGKIYGVPARDTSPPMITKAKPGYAVGAIYTRGGGGFDAFKPIYMKMTDKGLDPSDTYDGPHIGGQGGGEGTVGSDGNFIVGIHGKLGANNKMDALSVITLTTETAKEAAKKIGRN